MFSGDMLRNPSPKEKLKNNGKKRVIKTTLSHFLFVRLKGRMALQDKQHKAVLLRLRAREEVPCFIARQCPSSPCVYAELRIYHFCIGLPDEFAIICIISYRFVRSCL